MPDSVVMVLEATCAWLLLGCELNFHQQADAFVDMHAASAMASSAYSERCPLVWCADWRARARAAQVPPTRRRRQERAHRCKVGLPAAIPNNTTATVPTHCNNTLSHIVPPLDCPADHRAYAQQGLSPPSAARGGDNNFGRWPWQ